MCWSTPPMRTRNFIPPAATGSSANGRERTWYTTWAILSEFLRVTTNARVMRRPWSASAAWNFVAALLASPGLSVLVPTKRYADVAEEVILELPYHGPPWRTQKPAPNAWQPQGARHET